jgi:hypothetical protein
VQGFITILEGVVSAIQPIISALQSAYDLAKKIAGFGGSSNGTNGTTGQGGGRFGGYSRVVTPATGGLITGGTPGRDSVPALLTPGEVVLNRDQQMRLLRGGIGGDIYISIDGRVLDERVDYRVTRSNKSTARTVKAGRKW